MINTIFYYPQTLTFEEYLNQLGSEIAARTIVFAKDQKSIYMGGKKFGATSASDIADLKQYIQSLFDNTDISDKIENIVKQYFTTTPQDLPTASTTKKGCIKVGGGLKMTGEALNVDFSNLPAGSNGIDGLDGLVEQIIKTDASARASKYAYGVVRVGDGIDVDNGVISVTLTKGDKGDKGDTGAKGDKGDRGPAGPSYDDSAIRALISANTQNLQTLLNQFDQKVQDQVEEMLEDVQWMQEHWPSGSGSTSNFGQSDVESYLQMIGVWEENEAHTKLNAKWSKISQSLDNITARVQALEVNSGSGGTSSGSALTAEQLLKIAKIDDLETAVGSLQTSYTDFEIDENNELKVLRWLSSALDLYSNANATWADLASAAQNKSLSESGIAALQTRVTAVENGLISDARLTTMVQSKVNEVIGESGFVSTSALQDALQPYATSASMFAAVGDVQSDVDSAIASINVCARYETEVVNGKRVPKNYGTTGNPKYRMESAASIYADQIDISAAHKLNISAADQINIASGVLNAILDDASISANKISLTSATTFLDSLWATFRLEKEGSYAEMTSDGFRVLNHEDQSYATSYVDINSDGSIIVMNKEYTDSNNILGGYMEIGGWGFKHHNGYSNPGSDISFQDGKLWVSGLIAANSFAITESGGILQAGMTSHLNNVSTPDGVRIVGDCYFDKDVIVGGDIATDGNVTADNIVVRNRGNITVGAGGSITTPSMTIGSGNTAVSVTSNANGGRAYLNVDNDTSINGELSVNGDLNVIGDVKVNSHSGWSGTVTINGATLTFEGGILTNATGTGVTAAS